MVELSAQLASSKLIIERKFSGMTENRIKKFEERQKQLKNLSDQQLKERFWELCHKAVKPMVEYGQKYTSQSIERSVLLRMGIDSISSQGIVSKIKESGLLAKGAGHAVLKVSQKYNITITEAGKKILNDDTALAGLFS